MRRSTVIASALMLIGVLVGCSPESSAPVGSGDSSPSQLPKADEALDFSFDPREDIKVTSCVGEQGLARVKGVINNQTDIFMDYSVHIEALDSSGTRVANLWVAEKSVTPRKKVNFEATGSLNGSVSKCELVDVQREIGLSH